MTFKTGLLGPTTMKKKPKCFLFFLIFKKARFLIMANCPTLDCSSANAKKWEVELTTLKNNNARLTAALQESTANVEEWKKQLATYKEENARLRKKVCMEECAGLTSGWRWGVGEGMVFT